MALSTLLASCIKMLTKFTLIIHTFTGLPFTDSARKCFHVMGRHFQDGFITDYASNSVLQLGAYVFSAAVTFSAWAWIDATYGWSSLPQSGASTQAVVFFYLWMFYILFNL